MPAGFAAAFLGTLFLLTTHVASAQTCPTLLLVVEQDGRVSAGSRDTLRSAVKMGIPVRVGWSIDADRDGKPICRTGPTRCSSRCSRVKYSRRLPRSGSRCRSAARHTSS
jgi:hypothetical protein